MFSPVKKCLSVLCALSVVACSQPSAPEEGQESPAPAVEPAKPEKPGKTKPRVQQKSADEAPMVFSPVEAVSPFEPEAPGKRIAHVNVPGPYVAVTFDDGPHPLLTPQVLDIFKRHGARATFFVVGRNASRHPGLLARAAAEGHELGSHTWSHINMRASSAAKIISELDRTNAVIEQATGHAPKVMRPPYGAVNPQLVNMVYSRYGTPAIMWDVDTRDWRKPGVQRVINRAVGKARPGSIILLHDIHATTLEAVEGIVTGLQARGFKLVTVSELIAMGNQAAGSGAPEAATSEPAPASETPGVASLSGQQPELPVGAASITAAPSAPAAGEPASTSETLPH